MNYNEYANVAYRNLLTLQTKSGLFHASKKGVKTGYDKAWFRDCIYEAMGLEAMQNYLGVNEVYKALFKILHKHKDKIVWACNNKPTEKWQYIHARYHPDTLEEFWEGWGNMQNDMIGLFLFKVANLLASEIIILEDKDFEMLSLLIVYLNSIHYWEDKDNGMWEENDELHASSIGNCVAGLTAISAYLNVPEKLIINGKNALNELLPRESITKECDLSQLSLIWPCNIITDTQAEIILHNIETKLLRDNGVIRYKNDQYYSLDNKEAEWCFGLSWLAQIYKNRNTDIYHFYLNKCLNILNNGEMPELYLSNGVVNENCPLGWSEAMFIVALKDL